ncbi:ferric reductase transmembrane component protein [Rutstroemia sp. NJR-2017a WRK4]|nr:ferric reductase transmembrane component protein [Rutstroemia sp. NJR-2017a WRK4]
MNNHTTDFHSLEWLYNSLQGSVVETIGLVATSDDHEPDQGPPESRTRFWKLIQGTRFNRKLILTFPFVIAALILLLSVLHWSVKLIRWRRRSSRRIQARASSSDGSFDDAFSKSIHEDATEQTVAGSSGSSINSADFGIQKDVPENESTPLIRRSQFGTLNSDRRTIVSRLKAFLIYQPRPIPYVNKVLPSNGSSLFIISLLSLNLFYAVYHITWTGFEGSVWADRAGLVFVANLPFLYILGAKNQPLKVLTGVSYESLNIIHRRLGEMLCLLAVVHLVGMFCMWWVILEPIAGWSLSKFLLDWVIAIGLGAFLAYELLYATSLASFRQRWYELFLGLHIVLQAAALVLLYLHHPGTRTYVGCALAIFLVDRLLYRIGAKSITVEAKSSVYEDNETILLSMEIIHKPGNIISRTFGHSIEAGWKATDHVFVTIPSLGRAHALQAHPFTIASAAPIPGNEKTKLDLLIRARDGFSSDLLHAARSQKSLSCRLDGPYGSSHARELLEDSDLAVLIAGGSGIAVTWPIVHHLLNISRTDDENAVSGAPRQRIVLVWIIHKSSHTSWLDSNELQKVKDKGVEVIIPRATTEVGRPDLVGMMEGIVEGWGYGEGKRIGVVASGPDGMNRTVNNTCARFVKDGRDLGVTIEKFGW